MKQNALFKNMRQVLPLCLVCLVAGLTSCNSDFDIRTGLSIKSNSPVDTLVDTVISGCYSARVTYATDEEDFIRAVIIEAPDGLSDNQPRKDQFLITTKSELQHPDIAVDDTIDFVIMHYEKVPFPPLLTWNKTYEGYYCLVKPCE